MTENIQEQTKDKSLEISKPSESYLKETSNWALFFSILGFIGIGFMILASIIVTSIFSFIDDPNLPSFFGPIIGIAYFIFALIYILPLIYLYRFSTNMKNAIEKKDGNNLEIAFKNFKSHFKYIGIITIIIMGLYILGAIVMVFSGLLTAFW